MEIVVRSVDLGYGFTKYVREVRNGSLEFGSFASVAPVAFERGIGDALGRRRNTTVVEINGVSYEVGPDVELVQRSDSVRNMDDDFVASPAYLALLRAAIAYMKKDVIDILVVGLPVSTLKLRQKALERLAQSEHQISKTRTVLVRNVRVLAQPHGALIDYALRSKDKRAVRSQTNLVIDCGFRTFDWLVTHGLKPVETRSGSASRGMYDVLKVLSERISADKGYPYHAYTRLDEALRRGKAPQIDGKEFKIDAYLPAARQVAEEAVTKMKEALQGTGDIDNIVLVGGSAHFFKPVIESNLAKRRIVTVKDAQFANLRGFQAAGNDLASH